MVGVRVRPFNQREIDLNAALCLKMNGPTTVIRDYASGAEKSFAFDESFWSHDDFYTDDHGRCHPNSGGKYADQQYVFDTFGKKVLGNAW